MNKFSGVGERIRIALKALGYWKKGRPDVARFCKEKGYLPQYIYAWLKDRVPGPTNLERLSRDLKVPMTWIMFGAEGGQAAAPESRALEVNTRGAAPLKREGPSRGRPAAGPGVAGLQEPAEADRETPKTGARIIDFMYHLKGLKEVTEKLLRAEEAAQALAHVSHELTATLDFSQVANRIVATILGLFRVRRSSLFQVTPDSGSLVCVAVAGQGDHQKWIGQNFLIGAGVAGRAVLERRLVWSANLLADPKITLPAWARERAEEEGHRSVVSVPLIVREEVLGALCLGDSLGRIYTEQELALLSAFADDAALALENARLYGEASRRRREAEVLAELARTLNASLNLDTVLQRVAEGARELCRSDYASIALRTPGSDVLIPRHRVGCRYEGYDNLRMEPGKGIGGLVLQTGRPFRTDNYTEDPRISKDYMEIARGEGIVAELAVPIRIQGRVEGVLHAGNRSPRPFTDRDETILAQLADHAVIAIQNARLYEEVRGAWDFIRFIGESSADGLVTTDVHGRLTYFSPGAEAIFGYRAEEVLDRPVADYYGSGPEEAHTVMQRLRAEGRITDHETDMRARDGRLLRIEVRQSLLRDASGAIVGTLGVLRKKTPERPATRAPV